MLTVDRIEDHSFIGSALAPDSVVVDLGVCRGAFSLAVISRYGCRVIGAEPITELCNQLEAESGLTVQNVAIGGRDMTVSLYLNRVGDASVLPALAEPEVDVQETTMLDLQQFLSAHGVVEVDLLKVDIEGAEIDMFRQAPADLFRDVKQISLEYHDFLDPAFEPAVLETDGRLRSYGYERIVFSLRDRHDVLYYRPKMLGVTRLHRVWMKLRYKYWRGLGRWLRRHRGAGPAARPRVHRPAKRLRR
jgi:FkbM family methyltransferase